MNFCSTCGQPLDPQTGMCSFCSGYKTQKLPDIYSGVLKAKLHSPLILIFCLVLTASVMNSFVNSKTPALQLLDFLVPIGLWITYFTSFTKSDKMGLFGIKMISVIITIVQVLVWISVGLLILAAVLLFAVPTLLSDFAYAFFAVGEYSYIASYLFKMVPFEYIAAGILVIAIIVTFVNVSLVGSISRSVKSVIESFKLGENRLRSFKSVRNWLIIVAIIMFVAVIYSENYDNMISVISIFIGALLAGSVGKTFKDLY